MAPLLHFALPIYLILYLGVTAVWRSYLVWRRTGVNPYVFGSSDNAPDFIGRLFRWLIGLIIVVVVTFAFLPLFYPYFLPISWLEHVLLQIVGCALLVGALGWITVAQAQMGNAWRVGIDQKNQAPLIQHGLFRYSRNPIFLGTRATLLGFFLVLPNALTLLALVLGDSLLQIQVRLEEEFLQQTHGEPYAEYRRQVRRWL